MAINSNTPLCVDIIAKLQKEFLKQFKLKHPVNTGIVKRYNSVPNKIFLSHVSDFSKEMLHIPAHIETQVKIRNWKDHFQFYFQ